MAFILHHCHLFPPSILASSSCTPPYPSTSPRRADLLVFFPFRLLLWFVRFAQRHGYSCCSSLLLFFSPLVASSPFLSSLIASSLLSSFLRLCLISPCLEMRFPFFLLALRSPLSSSPLETGPVVPFVFVERTRRQERRKMRVRGTESTREEKRGKLRAERERERRR